MIRLCDKKCSMRMVGNWWPGTTLIYTFIHFYNFYSNYKKYLAGKSHTQPIRTKYVIKQFVCTSKTYNFYKKFECLCVCST